ncbi:ATP-binding protein [Dyadobacter bucti]|uniref:ATP-binding protein n=1 Tax=Dyadobacter bucti TaxID=2572203 RepID=UPI003F6EB017
MNHDFNPFVEQIIPEYFVGREDLLDQFRSDLNGLKSGRPNHQFIAGVHGTGKTSYLSKLVEVAKENGFLAVMPTLDAQNLALGHINTIVRSVVTGLSKFNNQYRYLEEDWDRNVESKFFSLPLGDELRGDRLRNDFERLTRFCEEAGLPGVVICIDEGQRIDGRALSAIKNSLQHLSNYLVVISLRLVSTDEDPVSAGRFLLNSKASSEAEGDIGASRFYVTGIPIGPFRSDEEASKCIQQRLLNNVIQFDQKTIERICNISGKIPKDMIHLSNALYINTKKNGKFLADLEILKKTFFDNESKVCADAITLVNSLPETTKRALHGLVLLKQPATASLIAAKTYPTLGADILSGVADGINTALGKLCDASTFCTKVADHFHVPNPIHSFALELALEKA